MIRRIVANEYRVGCREPIELRRSKLSLLFHNWKRLWNGQLFIAYDLSVKIRSQLQVKRQSGAFVGAFVSYGYLKSTSNRHQLIIDECIATIVENIFKWKIEGFSPSDIALKLNCLGILTPANYKTEIGSYYATPFKVKEQSEWSAGMILRILKNPIYIGVLQQGMVTTPSFNIKKRIFKPKEEWAITENSHEAIISKIDFTTVQKILATDTRRTATRDTAFPFSGLIFCGECGSNMVRKTVPANGKKYVYYICGGQKKKKIVCRIDFETSPWITLFLSLYKITFKLVLLWKKR